MTLPNPFPIGLAFNGGPSAPRDGSDIRAHAVAGAGTAEAWRPWLDAIRQADEAGLDFATFEDLWARRGSPGQSPLDATLLLARIGPATRRIGLLPAVVVSTTEPFHVSTAIATLDYVTRGRAGLVPVVPAQADVDAAVAHAGPDSYGLPLSRDGLYQDAAGAVDGVRRLWDSWEDGAIIRDVATGRFVDRDKLHYVDVKTPTLSIRGPSIVPRPPQGQPPVAVTWREDGDLAWAARHADILFVPEPADSAAWAAQRQALDGAQQQAGRHLAPLRYIVDVPVSFDDAADAAAPRAGREDAPHTAQALARRILAWRDAGFAGVRLHPRDLRRDVAVVTDVLLPLLQDAGLAAAADIDASFPPISLRGRLGLAAATNRYATAGQGAR